MHKSPNSLVDFNKATGDAQATTCFRRLSCNPHYLALISMVMGVAEFADGGQLPLLNKATSHLHPAPFLVIICL